MIRKVRPHINQNEALLFERSSPGKVGYQLPPLNGMKMRDQGLAAHGAPPMGDLTDALDLH